MGTDIHVQVEALEDGKWQWVEEAVPPWDADDESNPEWRDYTLFGFLAGVRGSEFEPQFPHRGWPLDADLADDYKSEQFPSWYAEDLHSRTWATLEELRGLNWDRKYRLGYHEGNLLDTGFYQWLHGERMQAVVDKYGAENIRVLFGFDS